MGTYPQYEWIASTVGYPDKYPNDDIINDASGSVNSNVLNKWAIIYPGSAEGSIFKYIEIPSAGKYNIWIRYQELPNILAPTQLIIEKVENI